MIDEAARLLDAVVRAYRAEDRSSVAAVLAIGAAGSADVCRGLLDLFPEAGLTVIVSDRPATQDLAALLDGDTTRVRFIVGGVVDLPDVAPGPYDLIFVRHPDIVGGRGAWEVAFRACAGELARDGLLIATTDLLPDAAFIDELMRSLSLSMRPGTPYTAVPVAMTGKDRYILMYTRAGNTTGTY